MKYSACHDRGKKKKSESPTGFEPMTSQTPGGRSNHLSYGDLMESEAIYWVHFYSSGFLSKDDKQ